MARAQQNGCPMPPQLPRLHPGLWRACSSRGPSAPHPGQHTSSGAASSTLPCDLAGTAPRSRPGSSLYGKSLDQRARCSLWIPNRKVLWLKKDRERAPPHPRTWQTPSLRRSFAPAAQTLARCGGCQRGAAGHGPQVRCGPGGAQTSLAIAGPRDSWGHRPRHHPSLLKATLTWPPVWPALVH